MRVAHNPAQGRQSVLAELCRLYWYPLYVFARRRGHSLHDAQDLTQGCFMHLPQHRALANWLQIRTGAIKTLIHRLRKPCTGLLREEVGRTVSDPVEIDEEIHALCEALIASEGRLGP